MDLKIKRTRDTQIGEGIIHYKTCLYVLSLISIKNIFYENLMNISHMDFRELREFCEDVRDKNACNFSTQKG